MIRPQNFEEVVRLKKCMELCKYMVDTDERTVKLLFDHLATPGGYVQLTRDPTGAGKLSLFRSGTDFEKSSTVQLAGNILTVTLTASAIRAVYPQSTYSGGDGGSSGNNNNNNNNNNNA